MLLNGDEREIRGREVGQQCIIIICVIDDKSLNESNENEEIEKVIFWDILEVKI